MAKGKSIKGKGGVNSGNESYIINGRGEISRVELVKEINKGLHPDTHVIVRNGVEYARNNPNTSKLDNIND